MVASTALLSSPLFLTGVALLWGGSIALLVVPPLRTQARRMSLFFPSNTPLGRGSARAATTRNFCLFLLLSFTLVAALFHRNPIIDALLQIIAVLTLVSLILVPTQMLFNWPRGLAPKEMREQPGAIQEWRGRRERLVRSESSGGGASREPTSQESGRSGLSEDAEASASGGERGRLTFYRASAWQDYFRRYEIRVDGESIGRLRRNSEIGVELPVGAHSCRAVIAWTGSRETQIVVRQGETRVEVLPNAKGDASRVLTDDEWLLLRPTEGEKS